MQATAIEILDKGPAKLYHFNKLLAFKDQDSPTSTQLIHLLGANSDLFLTNHTIASRGIISTQSANQTILHNSLHAPQKQPPFVAQIYIRRMADSIIPENMERNTISVRWMSVDFMGVLWLVQFYFRTSKYVLEYCINVC
jgi:hypothetical protein